MSIRALLGTAAACLGFVLPLPSPPQPERSPPPVAVADLFDPSKLAAAICRADPSKRRISPVPAALAAEPGAQPRSPMFEGLGTLSYKITTTSPRAQAFFDQGLRLFYAFNPGEAVASFRAASDADPACAMCFWGEALVLAPNLNFSQMEAANIPAALAAVEKARALAPKASPREQALIEAVAARHAPDRNAHGDELNIAYANAMAKVYAAHPDDPEIASIYAEAALMVTSGPWERWWDRTGLHPTSYVASAIEAIERVLAKQPEHPGAIHLYIHAVDNSAHLKKAEPYADRLARLMPAAGHMVHMPAHVFFNVGRYKDALATNIAALSADDAYLKGEAAATLVYRVGLYIHNLHFALASAGMAGDEAAARDLVQRMRDFVQRTPDMPDFFDVPRASVTHTIVRFGTPEEMLALPKPKAKQLYEIGVWHYARGTAFAQQGDLRKARAEADAIARLRTPRSLKAFGDGSEQYANLLGVAEQMVRGRAAAAEKNWSDAAWHFRKAGGFEEAATSYRDPPPWGFPAREAEGVALFRGGKPAQAAEVLRQALLVAPNSGFALHALKEIAAAEGDQVAVREYGRLFEKAWSGSAPPDLDRL